MADMESSATTVATRARKRVIFYVTGFGAFGGVAENPTSWMVPRLHDAVVEAAFASEICACSRGCACDKADSVTHVIVADTRVMEVAATTVDKDIHSVYTMARSARAGGCSGHSHDDVHIFLHFGVAAGAPCISLEQCAYNDASFRIPDNRGAQPMGQCIDAEQSWGATAASRLPVPALVNLLASRGHPVCPSVDPGRFLCNYAYYRSLCCTGTEPDMHSLFIHTPSYTSDTLPQLLAFGVDAVMGIAQAIATGFDEFTTRWSPAPGPAGSAAQDDAVTAAKNGVVPASDLTAELMAMGFSHEQAAAAIAATGGSDVGACVEWIVQDLERAADAGAESSAAPVTTAAASGAPAAAPLWSTAQEDMMRMLLAAPSTKQHKMVIVVRDDLGMGKGKIAAQTCHAALAAQRAIMASCDTRKQRVYRSWRDNGEPIVVLRCADQDALQALRGAAKAAGLDSFPIRDAGRTQVEPGTMTVMAIGPGDADVIDSVTGSLRLL